MTRYNDPRSQELKQLVQASVPYFKNLSETTLAEIVYSLEELTVEI